MKNLGNGLIRNEFAVGDADDFDDFQKPRRTTWQMREDLRETRLLKARE